ncbi:MAG: aldehyde ferredoxin oxidoreductase C-terminal domain-containing protein [Anaerolineae bacterium]
MGPANMTVRRLLLLSPADRRYRLRTLRLADLHLGGGEDALLLWGEALAHYLLREDPGAVVVARGPLAFLSGNKATVGYLSPLTGVPHYSFVGGAGFAQLLNLGLDAVVLTGIPHDEMHNGRLAESYVVVSGRAPNLEVTWRFAGELPSGQRSAYYRLLDRECDADGDRASVFTVGDAVQHGYPDANLAVDGLYHAGRGGAGYVFSRYLRAMVLRGDPMDLFTWMGDRAQALQVLRQGEIADRLEKHCARLSRRDGGTVTKLYETGSGDQPTLPARNGQRVGYDLADLGARRVLRAHRVGQTGCQWCQVDCRHWHWVDVDYAPEGRDRYLDDFEPTYALFAMLDLAPADASLRSRLELVEKVDRHVVVPIEQMGMDIIDVGVAIAALFEGLETGAVPKQDVPPTLRTGPHFGNLDRVAAAVTALRSGETYPAIEALGHGPQGLAERYPDLADVVFTCGPQTLGNPGHANALWTFLMPFSRFFSHYSGQIYKVSGDLRPDMTDAEIDALFSEVIEKMLAREFFICLGNALSNCGFTFVIFSQDGEGRTLDRDGLLRRLLNAYGFDVREEDLLWFAQSFWVQSLLLKAEHGWRPPDAEAFPSRVYDLLAQVLGFSPETLQQLMARLILTWKRQASAVISRFGHEAPWQGN